VNSARSDFVKNVITTKISVIYVMGAGFFKIIIASLSAVLDIDQKISFAKVVPSILVRFVQPLKKLVPHAEINY
jgi:hypothetical protein